MDLTNRRFSWIYSRKGGTSPDYEIVRTPMQRLQSSVFDVARLAKLLQKAMSFTLYNMYKSHTFSIRCSQHGANISRLLLRYICFQNLSRCKLSLYNGNFLLYSFPSIHGMTKDSLHVRHRHFDTILPGERVGRASGASSCVVWH